MHSILVLRSSHITHITHITQFVVHLTRLAPAVLTALVGGSSLVVGMGHVRYMYTTFMGLHFLVAKFLSSHYISGLSNFCTPYNTPHTHPHQHTHHTHTHTHTHQHIHTLRAQRKKMGKESVCVTKVMMETPASHVIPVTTMTQRVECANVSSSKNNHFGMNFTCFGI